VRRLQVAGGVPTGDRSTHSHDRIRQEALSTAGDDTCASPADGG
jgi:hypothetical protein